MSSANDCPVFQRHLGIWEGIHRVLSPEGGLLDEYRARVVCRREGDAYSQATTRTWPDGRETRSEFSGHIEPGRIRYTSPNVVGAGVEVDDSNILSRWQDPERPGVEWCSVITLLGSSDRCRTVQHLEGGRLVRLTVIQERKVA